MTCANSDRRWPDSAIGTVSVVRPVAVDAAAKYNTVTVLDDMMVGNVVDSFPFRFIPFT